MVILGDPSYGEEFGGPGRHEEALELANCADVATTCGLVDAFLQLKDLSLDLLPGAGLPAIPRCGCCRGQSLSTATPPSTSHVTGAPSAYPVAFPQAFASEPILLRLRFRWTPTLHWQCRERRRSYSVPGRCLSLRAGSHCSPRDVMGCSLEHAINVQPERHVASHVSVSVLGQADNPRRLDPDDGG